MSDYRQQQECEEMHRALLVEALTAIERAGLQAEAEVLAKELGLEPEEHHGNEN